MRRCCSCQKPVLGSEDSCAEAVFICSSCRANPKILELARQLLQVHLEDHRERGDFRKLLSNAWKDPGTDPALRIRTLDPADQTWSPVSGR